MACGTSVLVLLDHTFRVGRMSAQLVVCDLTFQAFPGGEQWEVARLARVNEQLLRVAETHVQELHGENTLGRDDEWEAPGDRIGDGIRRDTESQWTGAAGTGAASTMTDLGGCSSRECALVFIVVRDPNKEPLNMLVCLV